MALQPLTATLITSDHEPRVGAVVSIRIVAPDDVDDIPSELVEGIIAATANGEFLLTSNTIEKKTDEDGVAVFDLLPSALSRFGLRYEAEIEGARIRFTMPDAPTDLGTLFNQTQSGDVVPIIVQDEGTVVSDDATTLNLVGTGVEAVAAGDVVTITVSSSGLPPGGAARRSLRWNDTDSSWEAFSAEDVWYYALTPTVDMQGIADVMIDGLTNGFNQSIRGSIQLHYNPAIAEAVINRYNRPYYLINGANNSWEADGTAGNTEAAAAVAAFSVPTIYLWIILPADTGGDYILNRFWEVKTLLGGASEDRGILANTPAFGQGGQNIIIDGVTYLTARARIDWETGTTNHNFQLDLNVVEDAPTVVWQSP